MPKQETPMQKSWPFSRRRESARSHPIHQPRTLHPLRKNTPLCSSGDRSQVKRVVIGMEDPNPRVKGRGIET